MPPYMSVLAMRRTGALHKQQMRRVNRNSSQYERIRRPPKVNPELMKAKGNPFLISDDFRGLRLGHCFEEARPLHLPSSAVFFLLASSSSCALENATELPRPSLQVSSS